MSKKILFVVTGLVLFCISRVAHANIVINEVMYDLDGGDIDWVEIYNPDDAEVDITTLKLLVSNSTSNHGINFSSGSAVLHTGEYGVIVGSSVISNYTAKWGSAGNIFTSSFSLPNDTGKVEINSGDKLSPMSSLSYSSEHGGSGNGKSLQKISGTWQESLPTPGGENELSSSSGTNEETQGGSGNTTTTSSNTNTNTGTTTQTTTNTATGSAGTPTSSGGAASKIVEVPIKTKVTVGNNLFTGIQVLFTASTTGRLGENMMYGKYFWNFGDGDSKEITLSNKNEISHIYPYPGEYNVSVEYYANSYATTSETVNKLTVKVVEANIVISAVGNEHDFFVEVSNNTDFTVDISRWVLQSGIKNFVFPKNTLLSAKKKIIISPKVTGFTSGDKSSLRLLNSEWQMVFDFGSTLLVPVQVSSVASAVSSKPRVIKLTSTNDVQTSFTAIAQAEEGNEFQSIEPGIQSSQNATAIKAVSGSSNRTYVYIAGLLALIVVGVLGMRAVRKSTAPSEDGEDFELVDE